MKTLYILGMSLLFVLAAAVSTDAATYIIENRFTGNLSTQNVTLDWNNITGIPAGFADGVDDTGAGGGGGAADLEYTQTLINYSGDLIDTIEDYYVGGGINTTFTYVSDLITNVTINNNGTMEYINLTYSAGLLTEVNYG